MKKELKNIRQFAQKEDEIHPTKKEIIQNRNDF